MLTEKANYERELAKGMKKIYEMNYAVTTMNSLHNGIIAFKNDLLNQYNYTLEFVNSLQEEVIDPLKILLNDQNSEGKRLNNEMRKIEKEFKDSVDKLEKVIYINIVKNKIS
jgi:uncharacterized coiled-coil protein SlyX